MTLHTVRLWLARRRISSAATAFERAHNGFKAGSAALDRLIGQAKATIESDRLRTEMRLAELQEAFLKRDTKARAHADLLAAEKATADRRAEKFAQFLE